MAVPGEGHFSPRLADKGISFTEQLWGQGSFWLGEISRKKLFHEPETLLLVCWFIF